MESRRRENWQKREIPFAAFQTAFRCISQKSTKFLPINEIENIADQE